MRLAQRAAWLLAAPWRLVVLVAIVAVLPILVVGEAAAADTTARHQAAAAETAHRVAASAAASFAERVSSISLAVGNAAVRALRTGKTTPLIDALDRDDRGAVQTGLEEMHRFVDPAVTWLLVVDSASRLVAVDPFATGLTGVDLSARISPARGNTSIEVGDALAWNDNLLGGGERGLGLSATSAVTTVIAPIGTTQPLGYRLVAVVKLTTLAGRSTSQLRTAYEDAYLVDRSGHLALRASNAFTPDDLAYRDLSSSPAVASLALDVPDPLQPARVVRGAARAADIGWSVLLVDAPTAVDADLEAALAQQRALRFGLAGVLLLGAALVGSASATAIRRRRETTEALEQQTATADVLKTISRSAFDLQSIFDVVVENATKLCRGDWGYLFRRDGDVFRIVSSFGGTAELIEYERTHPTPLSRNTLIGRVALDHAVVHLPDLFEDPTYDWPSNRAAGVHTVLGVPIFKDDEVVGAIGVARNDKRPFTDAEIRLVRTFADQAAIAMENVRLYNETKDALERQTATSSILGVISRSPADQQPTLDAVVESGARLCDADMAFIYVVEGGFFKLRAGYKVPPAFVKYTNDSPIPVAPHRGSLSGRVVAERRAVQIPDVLADAEYEYLAGQQLVGYRAMLNVPMFSKGELIGLIGLWRTAPVPFTAKQIDLMSTFADQAVIAIENVRLFNETKEALEQQTAVGEVLKTISRSAFDLQPVLDIVVNNAVRLAGADIGWLSRVENDQFMTVAYSTDFPETVREELLRQRAQGHLAGPWVPLGTGGGLMGFTLAEGRTVHLPDLKEDPNLKGSVVARLTASRTVVGVPMLREGRSIGGVVLARYEVRPFTEREIALVQTFADQAAIAIENVRLFNETKESLERQTAIAQVLRAMSASPTGLGPVMDTIAESAARFCVAKDAFVVLTQEGRLQMVANFGFKEYGPGAALGAPGSVIESTSVTGRACLEARTIHVPDILAVADTDHDYRVAKEDAYRYGDRAMLSTPLLRQGVAIGAITLRRTEPHRFSEREIELLRTFADQAVIAIENVRLFNETKEALERQTATGEILRVISASPTDIQPVLDAIIRSARRYCLAENASIALVRGDAYDDVAAGSLVEPSFGMSFGTTARLDSTTLTAAVVRERRTLHTADLQLSTEYPEGAAIAKRVGFHAAAVAPMLREGHVIGAIGLQRKEPRAFSTREIDLLETFTAQAAIAIQNVRLFNETKEALEQQTAVGNVLKTISRSAFDLERVLATVVENAARLSDADLAWMGRAAAGDIQGGGVGVRWARDGDTSWGGPGGFRGTPARESIMGRAFLDRKTIHVDDITADEELAAGSNRARLSGSRTVLAVPLLVEGSAIGVILVARRTIRRFSDREVQIVETFADQAAIAIQNVRLFSEIQEQSRQLEIASRHKSEFLANMSHELRTPLNAIIGFSEVLLQGIFGGVNDKQREYLQDVLGSGQHLLSLINDILDLSKIEAGRMELDLSTFSVRDALESGLTIVRERATRHGIELNAVIASDVDAIEADERKVKQIFYNLLTNAVKFTPDGGRVNVTARSENGDMRVDVRDNGIGIAEADQVRIFEEFRQVGRERSREGTGLGLTLTKRFVELHGGRIWLESAPGKGSTFAFTLPLRQPAPVRV